MACGAEFRPDKKHDFDLEIVLDAFKRTLQADGSLSIDQYLTAFHELCRFFALTGRLFGFVARDLENKMKPIEAKRKSPSIGVHYATLQSMVKYELEQGTAFHKGKHPSASRQFLRLHYALEFILEFMRQLRHSDEDARTSQIASEVYHNTLSKHHPFVTRMLAVGAVYFLPSKKYLIDIMCKHEYDKVHDLIDDVTNEGQPIYDAAQKVYADNNITHIP